MATRAYLGTLIFVMKSEKSTIRQTFPVFKPHNAKLKTGFLTSAVSNK